MRGQSLNTLTNLGQRINTLTKAQPPDEQKIFEHPDYITRLSQTALVGLVDVLDHPLLDSRQANMDKVRAHLKQWESAENKVASVVLAKESTPGDTTLTAEFRTPAQASGYRHAIKAVISLAGKGAPLAQKGEIQLGQVIADEFLPDTTLILSNDILTYIHELPRIDDKLNPFLKALGSAIFALSTKPGIDSHIQPATPSYWA